MRSSPRGRGPAGHRRRRAVQPHVRVRGPGVVACSGHAVAAGALLLLGADYRVGARGELPHRPDRDRRSAWCCPAGRSSSRGSGSRRATSSRRRSGRGCTTPTARPTPASSTRSSSPTMLAAAATAEAQRWAELPARRVPRPGAHEPRRAARPPGRRDRRGPGPDASTSRRDVPDPPDRRVRSEAERRPPA